MVEIEIRELLWTSFSANTLLSRLIVTETKAAFPSNYSVRFRLGLAFAAVTTAVRTLVLV